MRWWDVSQAIRQDSELGRDGEASAIAERRDQVISVLSAYANQPEQAADAVLSVLEAEGWL